jgi:hypothetical protein
MRTLLLSLLSFAIVAQASVDPKGGLWSHSAVSIWGGGADTIPSPDGKKAIIIRPPQHPESDETHTVIVKANGREYNTSIGAWVNAEAMWSPDSKAFFVTYSDGGNVGTYHFKVVYVDGAGLHIIEPIPNGRKLFAPMCFDPERPNVAAVRWLRHDASRLLIAVEVPPHSSCASMGTFRAFEIALPDGAILSRYGQIETKRSFGNDLGVELLGAEEDCIRKPETCVPSGMKPHKPNGNQ